ncbi:hypothetical protein GF343_00985 [Candidatus Woesearchaeota archaeon]|nr:hypothetical protein [Candidatus Woesearchaeota archaeon]
MEERKIALWVLGIIVVIAIIGLFFLFRAEKTGSAVAARAGIPYYGGVYHPTAETYANPWGKVGPYARTAKPHIEEPSYITPKKDPTRAPTFLKGNCAKLAKYGIVDSEHIIDSNYQQSRFKECIEVEGSKSGYCCKKSSYIY